MSDAPPCPCIIRPIPPSSTHALRHAVLWPSKPLDYVILAEDAEGWHFGAFLSRDSDALASTGEGPGPRAVEEQGEQRELGELEPVSVISCFLEPLLEDLTSPTVPLPTGRFRKFATSPSYQGQGLGTALLQHTLQFLTSPEAQGGKGVRRVWCDARWEKRGFYERFGMRAVRPQGEGEGPTFYKGDVPYVRMVLDVVDPEGLLWPQT
ncbi:hypothetical protein CALVIDRAFT_541516 [Calocera viscosa TUFC12733]|uniref:N-acetyltransferase domain-containing protein n=1 Tax=Calocera viscosa (strain TUFC12733) TaxID=1330018 RepID=A0A167HLS5_CALVF|nr:hypothetical protein CALVIDRAFT_541516 [Calocera viscosa TUFC12733]